MKKIFVFGLFYFLLVNAFSKKDPEAWKTEKTLEKQFSVFKDNASSWNGFLMTKEPQLNEFHKSVADSVVVLEKNITNTKKNLTTAKEEILALSNKLSETQTKLDESLKKENELTTLGMPVDKNSFPTVLYSIIILITAIALIGYFLFFRSNAVTKETEQRYNELTDEFQQHKTKALERETKLRRELQTERNKNYGS